jgi:predicted ATPase/DNA-binding SARP family transcriptional activator
VTLELRLLGPLEVVREGAPVQVAGRKRRSLLALLALHAREPVARDRLIEELWPGHDPQAPARLQVYVSQLRRTLGAGALELRDDGYLLAAETDAAGFEQLAAAGRAALRSGDARAAAELLGEALDLWRGPALGELAYEPFAQAAADRLDQRRRAAREDRIDADLELGRDVLADAEELAQEDPLRERAWRALMLALYRAGRQADALAAYARARTVLVEELGLEPGPELRELQEAILRQDPGLLVEPEELSGRRHLPAPATALVGRRTEVDELLALMRDARLVTLTGPGGTGKTRLAIQAASELAARFEDGVWFVALAEIEEPAVVAHAIAAALGADERHGEPVQDTLAQRLHGKAALLVLDNFEQVVEAAPVVSALLRGAPGVAALVTSRAPLRIDGEHEYAVAPLPAADAVALFEARARAVNRAFRSSGAVAEVCAELDGLPLAIELAAARSRTLSPEELHHELAQRLDLAGPRDAPARHRTLRATLDWSYRLLDDAERAAFARLGVFAGGFSAPAAAEVCDVPPAVLDELTEESLLRVDRGVDGAARFAMLATVREYALERVTDGPGLRARHAAHFVALAEAAVVNPSADSLDRLEEEHANLRAALTWARRAGAVDVELRLVAALSRFWGVRGHLREGERRVAEALAEPEGQPPALRAKALAGDAGLALRGGDYRRLERSNIEARAICQRLGDRAGEALALDGIATAVANLGDLERSLALYEQSTAIFRELGDERGLAQTTTNTGCLALMMGDHERAAELSAEAVELQRHLGQLHLLLNPLFNLGLAAVMLGRHAEAMERFSEGVELARELGSSEALIYSLEGIAAVDVAEGRAALAALRLGAAEAASERIGMTLEPLERELHERTAAAAAEALGAAAYAAAHAEGALTGLDLAVDGEARVGVDLA